MNDAIGLAREQRIRERAYQLWEEAGRPEGEELDHWSRATEAIAVEDAQYELAASGSIESAKRIDRLAS